MLDAGGSGTRLGLGDPVLDAALGGGLIPGTVNELFGPASAGKTQLALQLALAVQLPPQHGGLGGGAMYISTDKNFPLRRLDDLRGAFAARHPGVTAQGLADRIFVLRVANLETQHHVVMYQLEQHMRRHAVRLVVIDSIASIVRSDVDPGLVEQHERSQCLAEMLLALKRIAMQLEAVVVCVNQVIWKPLSLHRTTNSAILRPTERLVVTSDGLEESLGRACSVRPAMSEMVAPYMNASFLVDRDPPSEHSGKLPALRRLIVAYSPVLASGNACQFRIHAHGIVGET
ncbi:DNA repair protein xrcc3 [Polyrhizophydium stewartii]|uniref:DNA repair protein xrcc3 n=1 Tax=Polyrhizophydium stewartii TaxID=2732419 RepID=A0ABR4NGX0_9FUNG|nr:DNA repair protein xrcc3 [Polyrhizophydium stewartii]